MFAPPTVFGNEDGTRIAIPTEDGYACYYLSTPYDKSSAWHVIVLPTLEMAYDFVGKRISPLFLNFDLGKTN